MGIGEEIEKQEIEKQEIEKQEIEKQEVEQQEVEKAEIEQQEVTQQVKRPVISNVAVNKKYDIIELLKLSFKLVKENKKKFGAYLLQLLLFFVIYLVVLTVTMVLFEYSTIRGTLFYPVRFVFIALMVIIGITAVVYMIWLTIKSVSTIDTGIESIELKKIIHNLTHHFLKW